MSATTGISLSRACEYFQVDIELVGEFVEYGLCPTFLVEGEVWIEEGGLERLRKALSLHRSLGINKEGIEAVLGLRSRISELEGEIEGLNAELERLKRHLESETLPALERQGLLIQIDSFA